MSPDRQETVAERWTERVGLAASLVVLLGLALPWTQQPQQPSWVVWLLLWSPGVLMLLGEKLACRHPWPRLSPVHYATATLLLWTALTWAPGHLAALLAGGWMLIRSLVAGAVLFQSLRQPLPCGWKLCLDAARIFPAIGAAWLVANRLNWMPFGFDALVVLLTAAHFHHAGFSLPLMAGLCGKALPGKLARASCICILAGVPLVALGITATHFHRLPWLEPVGVVVLVAGALGVALLQMRMGFQTSMPKLARALFIVSGTSLMLAMLLALGYGLRSLFPAGALSIPSMWALHGTLNTFGFGLCGILAWRSYTRAQPPAPDFD